MKWFDNLTLTHSSKHMIRVIVIPCFWYRLRDDTIECGGTNIIWPFNANRCLSWCSVGSWKNALKRWLTSHPCQRRSGWMLFFSPLQVTVPLDSILWQYCIKIILWRVTMVSLMLLQAEQFLKTLSCWHFLWSEIFLKKRFTYEIFSGKQSWMTNNMLTLMKK